MSSFTDKLNMIPEDTLLQVVYTSAATHPFTDEELEVILKNSRERNAEAALTGILLYHDGNILQVLEGPSGKVKETMQRILDDNRHGGVLILLRKEIEAREFGDWSMALVTPSANQAAKFKAWREDKASSRTQALTLLRSFARNAR